MSQLNLIHKKYKDIHRLKTTYANDFSIGNHIIIQEKIDGANACIRYDLENDQIIAQSRKCILSDGNTLRGFYTWAKSLNTKQFSILGNRFLVFGEWLVPHSIKYPNEDYNKFYVFDVYDAEKEEYLPQTNAHDFANALNLLYVPTFYDGKFTSWDDILEYVGQTKMGGEYGEGIVVKNQTTLNSPKLEFYVKIVGEKFQETKGSNAKAVDKEKLHSLEVDMNLAQTIVTTARVTKILNKLVDESVLPEDWGLESMGIVAKNLCKRIVEDCIKEEPETVSKINNFGKIANKIAMQYAKEMAMAR